MRNVDEDKVTAGPGRSLSASLTPRLSDTHITPFSRYIDTLIGGNAPKSQDPDWVTAEANSARSATHPDTIEVASSDNASQLPRRHRVEDESSMCRVWRRRETETPESGPSEPTILGGLAVLSSFFVHSSSISTSLTSSP
jgi:hypothetical protein